MTLKWQDNIIIRKGENRVNALLSYTPTICNTIWNFYSFGSTTLLPFFNGGSAIITTEIKQEI